MLWDAEIGRPVSGTPKPKSHGSMQLTGARLGRRRTAIGLKITAAGLILGLGSSCALWHRRPPKDAAGGTARGAAPTQAAAGAIANSNGASPGRQLVNQTLAGAGIATDDEVRESASGVGGGNGVPTAAAERRVGVVRVIGAHGKFVLIETTTGLGGVPLGDGQELHCRGPAAGGGEQTAVLQVSRERQAPFLVADVVSGEPKAGDVAYFPVKKGKKASGD
jgi:hypothetical protein